ncbi:NADP-dependent oxidoreductase domain-containing protein [Diplogelasinospora grovesii]|uniref:NADP-dependent oxidoreductase domain-containing protein n=1 Tax=Diplogelasinospora grovesii TaxID=303347 RepID=A0AAN6N2F9_9PEZI|nr:NADP-dependent oxidoreductase domain-containing protein [Diplogelasinospora grovesii]
MATAKRAITDTLALPNSPVRIPQLGFGVYKSPKTVCKASCLEALRVGYRHIDTAQYYENEEEVGQALIQSGLGRQDVFITTKILTPGKDVAETYTKCAESASLLGGYVDLFLIHSPSGGAQARRMMWKALEQLADERKAKAIGVSNYGIAHIEEMKEFAKVWPPHVNQIELHPWTQQRETVKYCNSHGIVVEAYCPIVRNRKAHDSTLVGIAARCGATPNQVLIRWCLQRGLVPLPKSDNPERIKLNADVYGFEISEKDMETLNGLDEGEAGALVASVEKYASKLS